MADGKVVIDAKINTAQAEKGAQQLKSDVMKLAQEYVKQGASMSDAMRKAWADMAKDSKQYSRQAGENIQSEVGGAVADLKKTLSRFGGAIFGAFSFAGIAQVLKECIELGSATEEVQNVVDTAFGDMAYKMEAFAQTAITSYGMSQLAAKQTGSTFMAMAKGIGIANDAASDMSIALAALSGDVASFYNISQEEAAAKLKSVFTGETESLKELGVVMTQTNLEQYALSKGITQSVSSMSQAEQAMLRYQFVMDALGMASGDFVKTQNSWANQTRILSMQIQQLGSNVGSILTSVLLPAVQTINDIVASLVAASGALASAIKNLFGIQVEQNNAIAESASGAATAENELAAGTAAAAKAAKKSLAGFDELNRLQGNTASGGGSGGGSASTIPSISNGAGIFDTATSEMDGLAQAVQRFIAPLMELDLTPLIDSFGELSEAIAPLIDTYLSYLEWAYFNVLVPLASWTIEEAAPASIGLLADAFHMLSEFMQPVIAGLQRLWGSLEPVFAFIGDTAIMALESLSDMFADIATVFNEKGSKIQEIIENVGLCIDKLWGDMEPILTAIRDAWISAFGDVQGFIVDAIGFIIDAMHGLSDFLTGRFTGDWEKTWEGLGELLKGAINAIIAIINGMIAGVVGGINIIIDALNSFSFEIPSWVPEYGGESFSLGLDNVEAPEIPYLARGAVIPPNREFLAVLGDQKHGTNVEAPLSTIQEAVAIVMEDMTGGMMAGFEALLEENRRLREVVESMELGEEAVAKAAQRYKDKMAIVKGG